MATDRLYYHDSFLYDFDARVVEAHNHEGKHAVVLDRTAFYPTSGGQVHDLGMLTADDKQIAITEVADEEDGRILHFASEPLAVGTHVRGMIDAVRRRDHVQQHSGQHVLSAAFIRLFNMPTVSFHMGEESCTIDLETAGLSAAQAQKAELMANEVIAEDRPVSVRFVPLEEARQLGLRKLPPKQTGDLRLIDITDFDLTACGGTHVCATGQIGSILLRKVEKVKQGVRVEFVCGLRAVKTARRDYATLTEAAALYSSHIYDVPEQVRKSLAESKSAGKAQHTLLEEVAELYAERLLAQAPGSPQVITEFFPDRDAVFIKLLAQKLTAGKTAVITLLASGAGQPTLIFAQAPGQKSNMGQLMKDVMAQLGGRGGGSTDMAQGGLAAGSTDAEKVKSLLQETAGKL
ncbi:MAG TPA: alanine--tRNA ligase-related protein [Candidatus Dormibacteraeota bacterium]|jgi:alanyl-tRNA synthetase|nr:alanine--tRNA ligase-related protein [Candidatus Dormibacteraeota bacterium]